MSEFIFVLKTFLMALLVVYVMQFKIGGISLESRFDHWVRRSEISSQSRQAAAGAALMIEKNVSIVKEKIQDLWRDNVVPKSSENAGK